MASESLGDSEKRRRSAFGAGMAEGLRLAGIDNPGEFMNEAKLARLESGLNGIAKKVLEAVPIQSPWTKDQIAAELRRAGCGAERNVIDGCLDTLRGRGVISEPVRGQFVRTTAKPKTEQPDIKIVHSIATPKEPMQAPKKQEKTNDELSRLAMIAKSLRQTAEEIESIALDVEERIQSAEKDTADLRQFKDILKSLSLRE